MKYKTMSLRLNDFLADFLEEAHIKTGVSKNGLVCLGLLLFLDHLEARKWKYDFPSERKENTTQPPSS